MFTDVSSQIRTLLAALLCALLTPFAGHSQSTAVDSLRAAFEAMRYEKAEQIGQRILSQAEDRSPEELLATHALLGIIAFNQNHLRTARAHFESLLSLDSQYELDPLYASPKVRQFFRRIKNRAQSESPPPTTPVRYIRVFDPRPGAAWRSLILPGWGHLYRGEKRLGYGVLGTAAVLATATAAFYMKEKSARDQYLAAKDLDDIARSYDTYNRYYRLRHSFLYALGGLWLVAYLDASFRPTGRVCVTASHGPAGLTVGFALKLR